MLGLKRWMALGVSKNKEWSSRFSELRGLGFILLRQQSDVVCRSEELLRWQFHEDSFTRNGRRSRVQGNKEGNKDASELSHSPGARQSPPRAVQCIHRVDTLGHWFSNSLIL